MIYILGGNGFVGSGFTRLFARRGHECKVIARDNYQQFRGTTCDVLINANGNSSKLAAKRDPRADFIANVTSTHSLLDDIDSGFYIHLSSCDVYPDCSSPALTNEEAVLNPAAQSPYGFHKYLSELCARRARGGWLVIRQGGFVGPGMKKNPIYDILCGDKLWLHPDSALQFIHTDDSAGIVWNLFESGLRNETVNVCGDGIVVLSDVMRWTNKYPAIAPEAAPTRYEIDITKLRTLCHVPHTAETVERFVRTAIGDAGKGG